MKLQITIPPVELASPLGTLESLPNIRRGNQVEAEVSALQGDKERPASSAPAQAYDVAMNGWELGGGSVRIHNPQLQQKQFKVLGISADDQRAKFGFLLDALEYGAPPMGGIAFGLDRSVTLMCEKWDSIRDVIAFPKTQRGQDLMIDTPSQVTDKQLRELHIKLRNVSTK